MSSISGFWAQRSLMPVTVSLRRPSKSLSSGRRRRHRRQDVEQQPSDRIGWIMDRSVKAESYVAAGELVEDVTRVRQRAGQPVELGRDQGVHRAAGFVRAGHQFGRVRVSAMTTRVAHQTLIHRPGLSSGATLPSTEVQHHCFLPTRVLHRKTVRMGLVFLLGLTRRKTDAIVCCPSTDPSAQRGASRHPNGRAV